MGEADTDGPALWARTGDPPGNPSSAGRECSPQLALRGPCAAVPAAVRRDPEKHGSGKAGRQRPRREGSRRCDRSRRSEKLPAKGEKPVSPRPTSSTQSQALPPSADVRCGHQSHSDLFWGLGGRG